MGDRFEQDELGVLVHKLRRGLNLSQQELAARANLTQGQISQIERGKGNPTVTVLDQIAKALGVATFVLIGGMAIYMLYQTVKQAAKDSA